MTNDSDAQNEKVQIRRKVVVFAHEKYTMHKYEYDIALILVDPPFILNGKLIFSIR